MIIGSGILPDTDGAHGFGAEGDDEQQGADSQCQGSLYPTAPRGGFILFHRCGCRTHPVSRRSSLSIASNSPSSPLNVAAQENLATASSRALSPMLPCTPSKVSPTSRAISLGSSAISSAPSWRTPIPSSAAEVATTTLPIARPSRTLF